MLFIIFTLCSVGTAKCTIYHVLFFLLSITRSGCLVGIRWSFYISKSQKNVCVSFSGIDSGFGINNLFVWSNFNFLYNSQRIISPILLYLLLFSFFFSSLLCSLIMWLIISLLPHKQHFLFCCVFSIFAFKKLVLIALFCAAIRRDSVSLLRLLFLSHIQIF